ncbi:MAG TPA: bifunctional precorrin-2 dehydrogenase/sirohydrochlorin ferrochelatase [bacterium]|nr:bifunctional precorrin-2 dehydrogenase/sirohydrochlorin ferrochelatase [bacterium]
MYTIALVLQGRRCVVIGGGQVAQRKILSLLESEAEVLVVSEQLTTTIREWVDQQRVQWLARRFQSGDLNGAFLAIAATNDRTVNEAVAKEAARERVLINVVDDPELCDFYVPAVLKRGDLQIAVSSGGKSPVLSKHVRERLEKQFGEEYGLFLNMVKRLREQMRLLRLDRAIRHEAEKSFVESPALSLLAQGKREQAEKVLRECLSKYTD